ncbi:MAG: acetyl-CoA carboxylase biotin carboxylase subunit [Syntrophothermus sp.]
MFKKILIANRAEIAVRIIRACKELGITSAAVYSTADKKTLHTRLADEAYHLEGNTSSETYLNKDKIIALAKEIKADAIHPGYGFFSENADFIEAVEKAGIAFIGPSSKSVKMMGSKTAARELMKKHNVPIVPGTTESVKSIQEGKKIAREIGYPILLKAAAGGGGKGMRKIESEKDFDSAFESTKREALKSFANDDVYIEKFIDEPKHIEVQVFGDKHGNYVHFFERDCSVQRRHQKIIEEAPASNVDEETRKRITTAAINAAKACDYFNAGTIELLMDKNKEFYFLEMNTRLQVEHPVTELITGFDLVKEQISVAEGNKLSIKQDDLKINGHAVECRIYAEDPYNNFLPSTGKITKYVIPAGAGVRVDTGIACDSEISMYYDPMIAKLICWGADRTEAINRLTRALHEYQIAGVTTNIQFLLSVLENPIYLSGKFDIRFIEKEFEQLITNHRNLEELNNAAVIFAALMKNSASLKQQETKAITKNNWPGLLYE